MLHHIPSKSRNAIPFLNDGDRMPSWWEEIRFFYFILMFLFLNEIVFLWDGFGIEKIIRNKIINLDFVEA